MRESFYIRITGEGGEKTFKIDSLKAAFLERKKKKKKLIGADPVPSAFTFC